MICPKCGTEFVEGVTHCSDCKVLLVAPSELKKETSHFMTMPSNMAKKLTDFLIYSEIYAELEDIENDMSNVYVEIGAEKRAKKLATVFLSEEAKNMPLPEADESEDDSEDELELAPPYVLAKDKHSDSNGTFYMLCGASIAVIGYCLKDVITNFSSIVAGTYPSYLTLIVFSLIGVLLVWGSVKYYKITKEVKAEIATEEAWHTEVSSWLNDTFSAESIDSNVTATYGEAQEEIFILNRYDYLKKETRAKFPELPTGFLDLEIENFYEAIFE